MTISNMKKYTDEDKLCLAQAIVDARQEGVAAMKTKIKNISDIRLAQYAECGDTICIGSQITFLQDIRAHCISLTNGGFKKGYDDAIAALKIKHPTAEAIIEEFCNKTIPQKNTFIKILRPQEATQALGNDLKELMA